MKVLVKSDDESLLVKELEDLKHFYTESLISFYVGENKDFQRLKDVMTKSEINNMSFDPNNQPEYVITQERFEFWSNVVKDVNLLDDRIASLEAVHGEDAVFKVYRAATIGKMHDIENYVQNVHNALDNAFEKTLEHEQEDELER